MSTRQDARRELILTAPLGFRLPAFTEPGGEFATGPIETIDFDAVYHDTKDLRLARAGVSLHHRADRGWTVNMEQPSARGSGIPSRSERDRKLGTVSGNGGARSINFAGDASEAPLEALDLVQAIVRTAKVESMAKLHITRRSVHLRTADGHPLAEIVDDDVSVLNGNHLNDRFRDLHITMSDDLSESRADQLVGRLRVAGARASDPTPKIVRALGPRAADPPDLAPLEAGRESTVEDVLRAALVASVIKLVDHDPGVRLGDDPEELHQARVAARRLRSNLRTFRPVLDETWANELRDELEWLGDLLGAVRDTDVLLMRLDAKNARLPSVDRAPARQLLKFLHAQREIARRALTVAMHTERYLELLDRLVLAAQQPRMLPPTDPVDDLGILRDLARRPWQHLRAAVDALPDQPTDVQFHAVRIRAKRARYAAEAVAPAFGKPARAFAKAMTSLQDRLGEYQDARVTGDWLRQTGAGSDRRWSKEVRFVAGLLAALEHVDALRARDEWPTTWKAANRKQLRTWL